MSEVPVVNICPIKQLFDLLLIHLSDEELVSIGEILLKATDRLVDEGVVEVGADE